VRLRTIRLLVVLRGRLDRLDPRLASLSLPALDERVQPAGVNDRLRHLPGFYHCRETAA
jgi:hypothetical protein